MAILGIDTTYTTCYYLRALGHSTLNTALDWNHHMALSLGPIGVLYGDHFTRIAIVATDYLGNTKAEWYASSVTECMSKAADLVATPDTKVYVYNTDNNGERLGDSTMMLTKEGVYPYPCNDTYGNNYDTANVYEGVAYRA